MAGISQSWGPGSRPAERTGPSPPRPPSTATGYPRRRHGWRCGAVDRTDPADERAAETALVRAVRAGDLDALDRLLARHEQGLYALCHGVLGHAEDAEDAVQETFLRALRALPGYRGDAAFRTWLFRIAVNACLNWTAGRRWREAPESELPALIDPKPTPAERLVAIEEEAAVRRAVAGLPDRQRITLLLRVYEDLSHREIAEVMGCSVGTVKANFFFALKNLRKHFEKTR